MMDSCDHEDYIVVYTYPPNRECPICKLIHEHEEEVDELKSKIEDLESEN